MVAKIGGYLLGEFGDLIANDPGCAPQQQLAHLQNKYKLATMSTRALLLTTFAKLANLFPEIKSDIVSILRGQRAVLEDRVRVVLLDGGALQHRHLGP